MTPSPQTHPLSIGELVQRTGVPAATLRSWEARYGFPRPVRFDGGHRRYAASDVVAVREVLRHREAGQVLSAAVRRVTTEAVRPRSVFAELRRAHPALVSQTLTKASLLALSRAIEDECCARAQDPVLFGAFQRARFLRASRERWVELARTARTAVVFADVTVDRAPDPLIGVALPHEAALNREWAVVCDAPDLPACLAAVERPGQDAVRDRHRRFDAVWTVDPLVVRDASRVAAGLADEYRPGWRPPGLDLLDQDPPAASADLLRASHLLNRTLGYLDATR
jgi:DICT domain-containing protein/predicted DNA-binding transcriptional regulator AlpA